MFICGQGCDKRGKKKTRRANAQRGVWITFCGKLIAPQPLPYHSRFPAFFQGFFWGPFRVRVHTARKTVDNSSPLSLVVRSVTDYKPWRTDKRKTSFLYIYCIFMRIIQGIFFEKSCFLGPPRADFQKVKQNRIKMKNICNENEKCVLIDAGGDTLEALPPNLHQGRDAPGPALADIG